MRVSVSGPASGCGKARCNPKTQQTNPIVLAVTTRGAPARILCEEKEIPRGSVITREISDFGVMELPGKVAASILKIPAPLACYWLSRSEGRS